MPKDPCRSKLPQTSLSLATAYPQMLSPSDSDPPHYPSTPITSAGFGNRVWGSGTGCDPPLKDPLPVLLKKLHSQSNCGVNSAGTEGCASVSLFEWIDLYIDKFCVLQPLVLFFHILLAKSICFHLTGITWCVYHHYMQIIYKYIQKYAFMTGHLCIYIYIYICIHNIWMLWSYTHEVLLAMWQRLLSN